MDGVYSGPSWAVVECNTNSKSTPYGVEPGVHDRRAPGVAAVEDSGMLPLSSRFIKVSASVLPVLRYSFVVRLSRCIRLLLTRFFDCKDGIRV